MNKISPWIIVVFFLLPLLAKADHITGGEMFYRLTGGSNNQFQYSFTLKLYMRCNSGRQFNNPTIISVFDRSTGERVTNLSVNLSNQQTISLSNNNPCITDPPTVCYDVGYYYFSLTLPATTQGYIVSSQVNYRISGINNLTPGYGFIGATYTAEIPGFSTSADAPANNSAQFTGSDLVMICAENAFSYSFGADDADGDRLQYHFCGAYISGSAGTVAAPPPPPYGYVPYGQGFSESSPLGLDVEVDRNTGLITGTAPAAGVYVVTVCVEEWRNNVLIATQRKDIQIFIAPCTIAAAVLPNEYLLCRDTREIKVNNGSESPLIHSYDWIATNLNGQVVSTSKDPQFNYSFPDTGLYRLRLWINPNEQCSDSDVALVRVYPGFKPAFNWTGICFKKPTDFTDATTSVYGTVTRWSWDLGETTVDNDVFATRSFSYTYPTLGTKQVTLITGDNKGCRDTLSKTLEIMEKPPMQLAFRDTLICRNDVLQLHVAGSGIFSWSGPLSYSASGPQPKVAPLVTSTYTVNLDDNGCINKDSVRVRVVDKVTLAMMQDTVICAGDTIGLHIKSDGLKYAWAPSEQFLDPSLANAFCYTPSTTRYTVTATIGGCQASKAVLVSTVPYPLAFAGPDTVICYGTVAALSGTSNGIRYSWSPAATLNTPNALSSIAHPVGTTSYILSAFDDLGCPKPGKDTVVVEVRARIFPFAGRDTAVIVNQPLQFQAAGGVAYSWSPAQFLTGADRANPIGVFSSESDSVRFRVKVYDEAGCSADASMLVKVFRTAPTVFVPTAFTPNHDGRNDELKPIAVGMQQILYFRVYNRWGQLVYSTTQNGRGWDGRVNGREQATDTYIWVVKATDFKGSPYEVKGTSTLIR